MIFLADLGGCLILKETNWFEGANVFNIFGNSLPLQEQCFKDGSSLLIYDHSFVESVLLRFIREVIIDYIYLAQEVTNGFLHDSFLF